MQAPHQHTVDYYVFNGDADGLCALQQLRLQQAPQAFQKHSKLITGVKRDIALLERIRAVQGARITVLDISLDKNRAALEQLLAQENQVTYIDHHHSGALPVSPLLTAHINTSPHTCTSLLVDGLLHGAHSRWAIAGAYGDNLLGQARSHATALKLDSVELAQLQHLGTLLNYNSYGESLADLHVAPLQLCNEMEQSTDPFDYLRSSRLLPVIAEGYQQDREHLQSCTAYDSFPGGRIFLLPDAPWARRVSGIYANQCATEQPDAAHAIIQQQRDGSLRISVRSAQKCPQGADTFCRQFPGGGGRAAAAGINNLPGHELEQFIHMFRQHFTAVLSKQAS